MYKSSDLQLFIITTGIKYYAEILYSFRLVLKGKVSKVIPISSRLKFLEKFSTNSFGPSLELYKHLRTII